MRRTRRTPIALAFGIALALVGALAPAASAVRNGVDSPIGRSPYVVALLTADGELLCGGTLVAPTKVLTAAHCVTAVEDPTGIRVVAGRTDYAGGSGGQERGVKRARVHPQYEQGTLTYDAAVLVLDRPLRYATAPIAGARDNALYKVGNKATVYGWGGRDGGEPATRLQRTTLVLGEIPACDPYTFPGDTAATKVCGLSPTTNPGTSICRGDSGGPLIEKGKLVGIVSSGNKYCGAEQPLSVFTRASAVRQGLGL